MSAQRKLPESITSSDHPDPSDAAERELKAQRRAHPARDPDDIDDTGVAAIVNNTGLDGDAASG